MRNAIRIFLGFSFLLVHSQGTCQQHPLFTQYMFNGLVLNPAYAGSNESLNLTAVARKQWRGFDGSPSTQTFSAHAPLRNEKISLGFIAMNDVSGSNRQSAFNGIYAYRIKTSKKGKLSMGLQTGVSAVNRGYDQLLLRDQSDQTFAGERNFILLNFGAGLYYYTDVFFAGISAPQILNNNNFQRRQYFYTAGYVFKLSDELKLKPSMLLKSMEGVPMQVDINCNLLIQEVLWLGISYRSFTSLSFLTQIQINKQTRLGYAYDNPVNRLKSVLNGSHEIVLTYNFQFFKSNVVSPRYF